MLKLKTKPASVAGPLGPVTMADLPSSSTTYWTARRKAEVLAAMERLHPIDGTVSVDGGLSRNGYFVQFLAEVAGHALFLSDETEQTAAGVAWMAAEASSSARFIAPPGRALKGGGAERDRRLSRFDMARQAVATFGDAVGAT